MDRRRSKGSGSVSQRGDGRWVAAVQVSGPGEPRKRRVFYGASASEVEEKMRAAYPQLCASDLPVLPRSAAMAAAKRLGTHTRGEWFAKVRAYGGRCHYCGDTTDARMTKDHLIPVTRGGSDAIDNLVPACWPCNSEKHNMTEAVYLAWRYPGRTHLDSATGHIS